MGEGKDLEVTLLYGGLRFIEGGWSAGWCFTV